MGSPIPATCGQLAIFPSSSHHVKTSPPDDVSRAASQKGCRMSGQMQATHKIATIALVSTLFAIVATVWITNHPESSDVDLVSFQGAANALLGTLTGAFTTYFVQIKLKRREQIALQKDRLRLIVMFTSRIIADMQNIRNVVEFYRQTSPQAYQLWQVVHTIEVTPLFKPDLVQLEALITLGSRRLVTSAMHLYGEQAAIAAAIERYNDFRRTYINMRNDENRLDREVEMIRLNMVNHLDFIAKTSHEMISEATEVQKLLFCKSRSHFGSADFLRLSDD